MEPYTEEDELGYLIEKNSKLRLMMDRFDMKISLSKPVPPTPESVKRLTKKTKEK